MVELNLRIDWSEMDMFGHVNNVSYFKYIQAARVNYWETIGLSGNFDTHEIGPILASTGCQFKKPLFYPGNIRIVSTVDFIKNTSFGLTHNIYNAQDDLCAVANDIVVTFNLKMQEKTTMPNWLRDKIAFIEQKKFNP